MNFLKPLVFSCFAGLILTCTSPQSPFSQDKAKVFLHLVSSAKVLSDSTITDTTGNTIRIGISFFMPQYFDSVVITVAKTIQDVDTFFVCRQTDIKSDSTWFGYAFKNAGARTVTAAGYVQGGYRPVATAAITVIARPINHKPYLIVTGNKSITSMEACTLFVSANDTDTMQAHTYKVLKSPSGYVFANQIFTWKPTISDTGTDTVTFTVTDNGTPPLSDSQKVVIWIGTNIALPDSIRGLVGVSRINGVFVFKWSSSKNADQYAVYRSKDTTGFVLFSTTQDTVFTNTTKDTAFYYYVVATNSKGQSVPSRRIRSTTINTAPTWSHSTIAVTINEGTSFSLNLADSVRDTNGDDITLQLVSAGPVNDSLVGTIWKYTPSYTDSGAYTVKIKGWDGMDSSILTIAVHVVNVPRPPQPQAQSLTTKRNTALQINLTATDPDGDAITGWLIDTTTTHGTAVLANAAQPTVTYTPTAGFTGTDYFTFKAIVGSLSSVYSAKITIVVDTNNIAPKISQKLSAQSLNKGDSLVLAVTINPDAFPAPRYYWYKAGTLLDSTSVTFWKKPNLLLTDSGFYYVIVSNIAGRDSSGARITTQFALTISSKLTATTTVNAGSSTPLSVSVNSDATPPPGYRWYFNGQPILNALANSYSKIWVVADTGVYKITVSNIAGSDSSFTKLIVNPPPNPLSLTVSVGQGGFGGTTTPSGSTTVLIGAATDIVANPSIGFTFDRWERSGLSVIIADSSKKSTTATLSADGTTTAFFNAILYNLTVGNDGNGTTNPSGLQLMTYGMNKKIIAAPSTGYHFANWTRGGPAATFTDSTLATTYVTVTGDVTITANFAPGP